MIDAENVTEIVYVIGVIISAPVFAWFCFRWGDSEFGDDERNFVLAFSSLAGLLAAFIWPFAVLVGGLFLFNRFLVNRFTPKDTP